jgi:hypothetical protein
MFHKFLPGDFNFFDLFEKQASYASDAAKYFKKIVTEGDINEESRKKIHDIEHQGDESAHAIIDQLNKTFITPFEREDIYALVKEIDDITDMLNTIVGRLLVYKLTGVNQNLVEFASVIEESVLAVACAIKGLRNTKNFKSAMESCIEVNRLENVGDAMRDKMLGDLFETEKDPIAVLKWKEIYQDAETILDICEDVAHVVETILVKQA